MPTLRHRSALLLAATLSVALACASGSQAAGFVVQDLYGRALNIRGVTLVDWEGAIANPAIRLVVRPPGNATFPLDAMVSANNQRLYFDLPSDWGAGGPSKALSFPDASSSVTVFMSVFGDDDSLDEGYTLTLTGGPNPPTQVPVHVLDQDRPSSSPPFHVTVEFGQDQTSFFADAAKRALIQRAAGDWAYYIGDMSLDAVPPMDETTFIWDPTGFVTGHFENNINGYLGYLLYAYGIHSGELRSGGEPSSAGGFQASGGTPLGIRRSGGLEIETQGNFNTLGWDVSVDPNTWWVKGNFGDESNDLFSIAHHEIGHSLFFNPANPRFGTFKSLGFVQDSAVLAYHHSYPNINPADHFDGEIDNASRKGAFGFEYFGSMPQRRWCITKLDLLCAQALGYRLRATSPFSPLRIVDSTLVAGFVGKTYADTLRAAGGIPAYNWTLTLGSLPPGLSLDSFTGAVAGTPGSTGTFHFTARAEDSDSGSVGASADVSLSIRASSGVGDPGAVGLRLGRVYPNPFAASATVRFALGRAAPATLGLYDTAGRLVRTLASGRFPEGEQSVELDGRGLASGVYLCRLESSGSVRVTRLVLTR